MKKELKEKLINEIKNEIIELLKSNKYNFEVIFNYKFNYSKKYGNYILLKRNNLTFLVETNHDENVIKICLMKKENEIDINEFNIDILIHDYEFYINIHNMNIDNVELIEDIKNILRG